MSLDTMPPELQKQLLYLLDYHGMKNLCDSHRSFGSACNDPALWIDKIKAVRPTLTINLSQLSVPRLMEFYRHLSVSGYMKSAYLYALDERRPYVNTPNVIQIACTKYHIYFLDTYGSVYVLGETEHTKMEMLHDIIYIACTDSNLIAVDSSGAVFSYLDSRLAGSARFSRFNISNIIQVACGGGFTVCLDTTGNVYSFGSNKYGQLGLGNVPYQPEPVKIPGLTNIVQVACGNNHTICLDNTGSLMVFGNDISNQLGLVYKQPGDKIYTPVHNTILTNIIYVAGGYDRTYCISENREVYVFGDKHVRDGDRRHYQEGNFIPYMAKIPDVSDAARIYTNHYGAACIVTTDDEVYQLVFNTDTASKVIFDPTMHRSFRTKQIALDKTHIIYVPAE